MREKGQCDGPRGGVAILGPWVISGRGHSPAFFTQIAFSKPNALRAGYAGGRAPGGATRGGAGGVSAAPPGPGRGPGLSPDGSQPLSRGRTPPTTTHPSPRSPAAAGRWPRWGGHESGGGGPGRSRAVPGRAGPCRDSGLSLAEGGAGLALGRPAGRAGPAATRHPAAPGAAAPAPGSAPWTGRAVRGRGSPPHPAGNGGRGVGAGEIGK